MWFFLIDLHLISAHCELVLWLHLCSVTFFWVQVCKSYIWFLRFPFCGFFSFSPTASVKVGNVGNDKWGGFSAIGPFFWLAHRVEARGFASLTPNQGSRVLIIQQHYRSPFSVVSNSICATTFWFCSVFRSTRCAHCFAPLQIQSLQIFQQFCESSEKRFGEFGIFRILAKKLPSR